MRRKTMFTILVMALGLMVWSAPNVHGAQYLTVNGQDVTSITLGLGQSYTVEVVSTDSTSYIYYIGFDNGVVLGDFSHLETKPEAGDLAAVVKYDQPTFYGYYINAAGISPAPSPGTHFVFGYTLHQIGETDVKLYDSTFTSLIDSIHITVVRPSMGTAFTYQSRLMDNNQAAEGLYDFQFKLYDYVSGGSQLGSTIDINDLDVIDGQFALKLDFGSHIFDGNAVWLETTVAHGDGNDPCTLTPRVELTPTPYALCASSVVIPFELSDSSTDPIISATNSGTGHGVHVKVTDLSDSENCAGYFESAGSDSGGVYGAATGTWGVGVTGTAMGSTGRGVRGLATNTGDYINFGGYFKAYGEQGRGVYGLATGRKGKAVYGEATNSEGVLNCGGYFVADGEHGKGVYGEASNTGGSILICGGHFVARGSQGRAVFGQATNTGSDTNYGGYFVTEGAEGQAVCGKALNNGDVTNYGGYFVSRGGRGAGVEAHATGTSSTGVRAQGREYDFFANGHFSLDYGTISSIRWKNNIRAIDEPLEKVMSVRGVYFNWDDEHGGHHDVGMIAEEVGEVMPEIVVYEENGVDANGMEYGKLTPLLVEAVKELKLANDSLEARVEALERAILQLAKTKESEL